MTLLPDDGAHVAIHLSHGRAFIGHGATPAEAARDAEHQASTYAARETARTVGLTVAAMALTALACHILTP